VSARSFFLVLLAAAASADCIPFSQAREHIGEDQCVTGTVFRIKHGERGVTWFDFCEDFRVCPFTVVVFPGHLRDIGDVRQLEKREIQVHGTLKEYDGRAEIVLSELRQLGGDAVRIPKLPKNYDVENRGRYSAGSVSFPRTTHTASKRKQVPDLPIVVVDPDEAEDPSPARKGTDPSR
jgi:hypothetical protein